MPTETRGTMHGWIWRGNLLPFVETIADLVRYRLDDSGLTAGVESSDADNDLWFTFVLDGQPRVEMHFAGTDEPGAGRRGIGRHRRVVRNQGRPIARPL